MKQASLANGAGMGSAPLNFHNELGGQAPVD